MHASALENIARCRDRYLTSAFFAWRGKTKILCAGETDGPGSYRPLFSFPGSSYVAVDLRDRAGVDRVLQDPQRIPFADGTFHIVLGGPLLGQCEPFERHFVELVRLLHPRGLLFMVVVSALPPEALDRFARLANISLIEKWIDKRGPSRDLVGVFSRHPGIPPVQAAPARGPRQLARLPPPTLTPGDPTLPDTVSVWRRYAADAFGAMVRGAAPLSLRLRQIVRQRPRAWNAETSAAGATERPSRVRYTVVLEELHRLLEPRLFVEIGVRHGRSLRLARGRAIGIDPASCVNGPLPPLCTVVSATSDEFFELKADALIDTPVDLAFIDGLHLFEYALRDFMNLERLATPAGIIVFDDVLPNDSAQAERVRRTEIWMGDVWKIAYILREYRPELTCIPVDVATGGLLIVAGLAPGSNVLWERYNEIVERFSAPPFNQVPREVLTRARALDPSDDRIPLLITRLRELRHGGADPTLVRAAIASIFDQSGRMS